MNSHQEILKPMFIDYIDLIPPADYKKNEDFKITHIKMGEIISKYKMKLETSTGKIVSFTKEAK